MRTLMHLHRLFYLTRRTHIRFRFYFKYNVLHVWITVVICVDDRMVSLQWLLIIIYIIYIILYTYVTIAGPCAQRKKTFLLFGRKLTCIHRFRLSIQPASIYYYIIHNYVINTSKNRSDRVADWYRPLL